MSDSRGRTAILIVLGTVCSLLGLTERSPAEGTPQAIDFFEKEVRPLLTEKCLKCHGPRKQEGGLRVDSRSALLKGGESGAAIVPGEREQGTLMAAIRHVGELRMPPSGKLTEAQIATLGRWIADGASWPEEKAKGERTPGIHAEDRSHWAFQPVREPTQPSVRDPHWALSPIDRFIQARLESAGGKPAPPADRRTLIRRATYDLTGLPPTPGEIDDFLNDSSPDAFARVIDRLLASKQYGERWGRHWMDVARYADTAGDGADYPVREAYLYRNWVIQAFNSDLPYDRFLRDQLAGDILTARASPGEYADRMIATGFLAIGKRYGYNPGPDFQHLDFADVIESVGRSVLGLSLGCARCHDHKYEPLTMADYYALYGILQSTKWSFPGGEEHKRPANLVPLVPPSEAARLDGLKKAKLAELDAEIARLKSDRAVLDPRSLGGAIDLDFEGQPTGKTPKAPWYMEGANTILADAQSPFHHVHPAGKQGVRLGSGKPTDGIRYVLPSSLRPGPGGRMHFGIDFRTLAPMDQPGAYRFYVGRGVIASLAVEFSVTATEFAICSGGTWEVVRKLEPGTWYTLQVSIDPEKKTYSGRVGRPGDLTPFDQKQCGPGWDGVLDTFICDATGHVPGRAPARDLDNVVLRTTPIPEPGGKPVEVAPPAADLKEQLARLDQALARATAERNQFANREMYPQAYAVAESTPTNAKIQLRGEPDRPGPETPRRFIEILGGDMLPTAGAGSGRAELADWITRPTNPLTARVFVNRVWAWHFGRGLVPTTSDFGLRGDPPSHPELLDWLASKFVQSGWSVKGLHRLIMSSAVYQQASETDAEGLKLDPDNRLLGRFQRRPLDAESIRDSLLALSGRLDPAMPAGHPFPDVNTWGYTIHAPFHAVYETNHRSVYLMLQRNRRHPFLARFDAADPNLSVGERLPTITPTQSLYLMNSPFVQEQAEGFARRLLGSSQEEQDRIRLAFTMAHGREPSANDVQDAVEFLRGYRSLSAQTGQSKERQEQSAWTAFARVLMTSNAMLYVD